MVQFGISDADVEFRLPTRKEAFVFWVKTFLFRLRCSVVSPKSPRWERESHSVFLNTIAESKSELFSSELREEEFALQSGKIQNLRVAARHLDGLVVPAGETFSFWAQIPRPVRRNGFVKGRELREGCIVPSVGGGLCQLSNALYAVALQAGFEIVERHAHSRKVPGSFADAGEDATIFWNYVDLKFRAPEAWQLSVELTRTSLVVRILSEKESQFNPARDDQPGTPLETAKPRQDEVRSCETCGMTSCFQNRKLFRKAPVSSRTAWAVDSYWPEFGDYMSENQACGDLLLTPLSAARRWGAGRYPWPAKAFSEVIDFPAFAVQRSLGSRRLADQGAERQKAYLKYHEGLARRMAGKMPHEVDRIVVNLELLPFLWKEGVLGGRKFEVFMTRFPLSELQARLDQAAKRWPESSTLTDFRVDQVQCKLETEALREAEKWISPHPGILAHTPEDKRIRLPWKVSPDAERLSGEDLPGVARAIIFPATTAARNGACEIREAIRLLGIPLKALRSNVEGDSFWDGCDVERIDPGKCFADSSAVLVFPAWISHRPVRLLKGLEKGMRVITTKESGISDFPGVIEIPTGDPEALAGAISDVCQVSERVNLSG